MFGKEYLFAVLRACLLTYDIGGVENCQLSIILSLAGLIQVLGTWCRKELSTDAPLK